MQRFLAEQRGGQHHQHLGPACPTRPPISTALTAVGKPSNGTASPKNSGSTIANSRAAIPVRNANLFEDQRRLARRGPLASVLLPWLWCILWTCAINSNTPPNPPF